MRSSSSVTLPRLFGKGCGCESLTELVLLGNSASRGVGHLQEERLIKLYPVTPTVGVFNSAICFDGIFLVFLRPAYVSACVFSHRALLRYQSAHFLFCVSGPRPYLSVPGTPSLNQPPQSACDSGVMT